MVGDIDSEHDSDFELDRREDQLHAQRPVRKSPEKRDDGEWIQKPSLDLDFSEARGSSRRFVQSQKKSDERLDRIEDQIQELSRLSNVRLEKLSIKIRMLEEKYDSIYEDTQKKISVLNARSSERPKMDLKIEELIEKHNQVVRMFEARLNQLKKIVEGQEIELLKASNELQEARKELAKLKRL